MTGLAFAILPGLYFLLFPCKGKDSIKLDRTNNRLIVTVFLDKHNKLILKVLVLGQAWRNKTYL
jgi:hypothetical protein